MESPLSHDGLQLLKRTADLTEQTVYGVKVFLQSLDIIRMGGEILFIQPRGWRREHGLRRFQKLGMGRREFDCHGLRGRKVFLFDVCNVFRACHDQ